MQLNLALLKHYKTPLLITLISCGLFFVFAYNLERTQYLKLVTLYTALFGLFYWLIKKHSNNLKFLTLIAFLFRAVFILAIPNLSQDFYRFIWDGNMTILGFNPYLSTPEYQISQGFLNDFPNKMELYEGMGKLNASHFTNYPPINQFCFVLANLFPGTSILSSVIGLRLIIIAADFGTLYFGKKLLQILKLPAHHIFWYILNPFIIIELTGNLHFEGVMIFFLIWSLYLLVSGRWIWAAVVLALSISTKLIPLIFLPLVFQWFISNTTSNKQGITKLILFYTIVGGVTLLLFAPFFSSQFISNYTETVALWLQNFEFNASLYYIAREIGYALTGYNQIAIIGKIIPLVVILFVLIISFFRKNKTPITLITAMLLVLSFYYFTATTVHPWYVATLLALNVFTKYKFPLVWSFVIILSYLAYIQTGNANKHENLIVITIEYLIVYGVFFWDVYKNKLKAK
ncbi:mannosyltransferase [Seonamhaeicola sp. S2-3]|uniref:mannosyltransferase n=1 Tax=Seonamhaeicola sp. S2-3 TaxID=1936081 RepID=UPI0009727322|nr:mannosyltransferase [Seonamhaeicola sp. S2-3]APY11441.1 mannosyltransferase [Seonamhaeicola sp. S2-3]